MKYILVIDESENVTKSTYKTGFEAHTTMDFYIRKYLNLGYEETDISKEENDNCYKTLVLNNDESCYVDIYIYEEEENTTIYKSNNSDYLDFKYSHLSQTY